MQALFGEKERHGERQDAIENKIWRKTRDVYDVDDGGDNDDDDDEMAISVYVCVCVLVTVRGWLVNNLFIWQKEKKKTFLLLLYTIITVENKETDRRRRGATMEWKRWFIHC